MSALPDWLADYVGIPYRELGRDRRGVDCWGLIVLVLREQYEVLVPTYEGRYREVKDQVTVARLFFEEATSVRWRRVELDQAEPGDVLSLSLAGVRHVGLLVAPGRFLHVLRGRETCVERLAAGWLSRIEGVYRHVAPVPVA